MDRHEHSHWGVYGEGIYSGVFTVKNLHVSWVLFQKIGVAVGLCYSGNSAIRQSLRLTPDFRFFFKLIQRGSTKYGTADVCRFK